MIAPFTVTASSTGGGVRDLWRKVGDELKLVPVKRDEDGYGCPDPKRYKLILSGLSDSFEEEDRYNPGEIKTKVVCEFMVVGSKKWEGTRFSSFYNVPKDWTDDRAYLGHLAAALNGKSRLEKGDAVNFQQHILHETVFEAALEVQSSARGYDYPKITTYLALDPDDDDSAPVAPRQRAIASDDEFPE